MNRLFLCILITVGAAACGGVHRATFESVFKAGNAINTALADKADLPRYRGLVSEFSAALTEVKALNLAPGDLALMGHYEAAQTALKDIQLVWEEKLRRQSDMLPISEDLAARIAREYSLGINTNEPPSIYAGEAMQTIWAVAKTHLDAANAALQGG